MTSHVALDSQQHRDLRIRGGVSADYGDAVMACLTVPTEFRRVQNEYPILFRRGDDGNFSALALFGFENGENLFLDGTRWDARYRPLAMSIQPFLVGRSDDPDATQLHIDMDHPRIAPDGEEGLRAIDDNGRATPYLDTVMAGLDELDQGYRSLGAFFAALERYDLLEPFALDVSLNDGSSHRMVGYHLINEERVRTLDDSAVADLHREGVLMPAFMAIASLSNFGKLVDRKNRRLDNG